MIAPPICPCGRPPTDERVLCQLVYVYGELNPDRARPAEVLYDHGQFACVWVKTWVEGRPRPLWTCHPRARWTR